MPALRLSNWFAIKDGVGLLLVGGRQYDVRVTIDKELVPGMLQYHWRMRQDGHIINNLEQRLSHYVWTYWNGYKPKRLRQVNGDPRDCRQENLAILKLTPESPERGDGKILPTSPSLNENVSLSPARSLAKLLKTKDLAL